MSLTAKQLEYKRAWKKANPDKVREAKARHRARHKDELSKKHLDYIHRSTKAQEYRAAYHRTPKARINKRLWHSRNKALRRKAKVSFTKEQFLLRCEYYGWRCYLCGISLTTDTLNIEHRIPLTRNGTNWPANLAPACPDCNTRKGNKTEIEYRLWAGIRMYSYYIKTHLAVREDLPL